VENYAEWKEAFGKEGADVILQSIEADLPHYEYLKQFSLVPPNSDAASSTCELFPVEHGEIIQLEVKK
jgi:hypothetical protein